MNVAAILKAKGGAVQTARPDTPLLEISRKLAARKIGAIVIVGDGGRVAGIISERDIIRTVAQRGPEALSVPVSEVMTRQVVTVANSTTLDELMSIMTANRFRHLPVVDDTALIGIVSMGDVVKHHIAEVELEVSAMRGYLAT